MQFTRKLLLTTLICLTGAQLAYCSQVQARLTASSTAATTLDEQKRKQALELLRQANELLAGTKDSAEQKQAVAQAVMQATAQAAPQTTGQEIVERDAKRVKTQEKDENPKNWLDQYAGKVDPEEQKKLEAAKIQAFNKNRTTILPHILYDLLTCMPRELIQIIAAYDPHTVQGKLVGSYKPVIQDMLFRFLEIPLNGKTGIVIAGRKEIEIIQKNRAANDAEWTSLLTHSFNFETKDSYYPANVSHGDKNNRDYIMGVSAFPSGTFVITSRNGTVIQCRVTAENKLETQKPICTNQVIHSVTVVNDYIIVGGERNKEWETQKGQLSIWGSNTAELLYHTEKYAPTALAIAPNGYLVFVCEKVICIAQICTNQNNEIFLTIKKEFECPRPYYCRFSPDIKFLPDNQIFVYGFAEFVHTTSAHNTDGLSTLLAGGGHPNIMPHPSHGQALFKIRGTPNNIETLTDNRIAITGNGGFMIFDKNGSQDLISVDPKKKCFRILQLQDQSVAVETYEGSPTPSKGVHEILFFR